MSFAQTRRGCQQELSPPRDEDGTWTTNQSNIHLYPFDKNKPARRSSITTAPNTPRTAPRLARPSRLGPQPDPFRTFTGAAGIDPPLLADALTASYGDLFVPGRLPPRRLDLNTAAALFELALGLSARKEFRGSRRALRCNPSSGNLHPTEGNAILPHCPGLSAGVYHYVSRDHRLERRHADCPGSLLRDPLGGSAAEAWRLCFRRGAAERHFWTSSRRGATSEAGKCSFS